MRFTSIHYSDGSRKKVSSDDPTEIGRR